MQKESVKVEEEQEHSISPAILGLIAVLAVGGILFLGMARHVSDNGITGDVVFSKYAACCTIQPMPAVPAGFPLEPVKQVTQLCYGAESMGECCLRAASTRFTVPAQVVSATLPPVGRGTCSWAQTPVAPTISYPASPQMPLAFPVRNACCTFRSWYYAEKGEKKSIAQKQATTCGPAENAMMCCNRAAATRPEYPSSLVSAQMGDCSTPEVSYPAPVLGTTQACCTVELRKVKSSGIWQTEAKTTTEACSPSESPLSCCVRTNAEPKASVNVLGAKTGACNPPQVAYPAAVTNGYAVCCTMERWQQAPTGYAQGTAKTATRYCDPLDTPAQCCIKNADSYPGKFLGVRMGECQPKPTQPVSSYPMYVG